jgi:hypothetical protein
METTEMAAPAGGLKTSKRRLGRRLAAAAAALAAALGTIAALGVTPARASSNGLQPQDWGVYTITNVMSGEVADITGGSTSWLTPVESWPANNGEDQKFHFVVADSYLPKNDIEVNVASSGAVASARAYLIVSDPYSDGSSECLEAEGNAPGAGDGIEMYGCNPSAVDQPNQLWYPVTIDGRTYLINGISVLEDGPSYVYQEGQIQEAYTSFGQYPDQDPVLVMTPVGMLDSDSVTGHQLVLEPSDASTYLWWQGWAINPTEYAVDTSDSVPASSVEPHEDYYGCLNGWNPETSDGSVVDRSSFQYSNMYADGASISLTNPSNAFASSEEATVDGEISRVLSLGEWAAASDNAIQMSYYNLNVKSGWVKTEYYCDPAGAAQLTG